MEDIVVRIKRGGVVHAEQWTPTVGQIFCEVSGEEDECRGDCCEEELAVIKILPGGEVASEWWTPTTGELLCELCGECDGRHPPVDCVAGNPWCG